MNNYRTSLDTDPQVTNNRYQIVKAIKL